MIAKAIGPQNTVGAMGISPRMVDSAVSIIGRKRPVAAVRTASSSASPAALSCSICTIRISAFLATIPSSDRMPRIATKPSGLLDTSSAETTPISPSGMTISTMIMRWKFCSSSISAVIISRIISGATAITEARLSALSSAMPPTSMR